MSLVDWVNRNQGFVTALLTLIYVVATIAILIVMTRANAVSQQNLALLREIEKSRLRPYVTFDVEIDRNIVFCLLKNHGLSVARDIRVQIEPTITGKMNGQTYESSLTKAPIGSLAPGRELREVLEASPDFLAQYPTPVFRGNLRYCDAAGVEYLDPLVVDLTIHQHMLWADLPDYRIEAPKLENTLREVVQAALRARQ
jgi:hypothetical protein